MGVYKNWKDLENAIKRETRDAIRDTTYNGQIELISNLEYFYETEDPKQYVRTDHLGRASRSEYVDTTDGGCGTLYMDMSVPYTTGTYTTEMVFENAEDAYPPANILGNPHFWKMTMDKIENEIMPKAFMNHGFK